MFSRSRRNRIGSGAYKETIVQKKLYSVSKSLTEDYLLKCFLTYLLFEICLTNLRSKTGSKTDLGYAYHFSKGRLVSLDKQLVLRKSLLNQCEKLAEKYLPYLSNALKKKSVSSTVSAISHDIKKELFSGQKKNGYKRKGSSKPFLNVIVGSKQRSQLDSDYELATNITRIIPDGKCPNVTFDLSDIESFLGHSINSLTKDLLEIAFVVYISDLYVERTPDLSRRFGILIPVRHPDIWTRVSSQIERAASFLARDDVKIYFIKKKEACDGIKDFNFSEDKKRCCCLVSGGLDSAVGAVWALNRGYSPFLVSYSPGNLSGIQKNLIYKIEQATNRTLKHLTISWQPSKRQKGQYRLGTHPYNALYQHLRSFFYVSLATAIALESECNVVYTFENGPVAINPLLSESHINTRTVHPLFLQYYQSMVNSVFGSHIVIKNPFIYKTKGELVRYLVNKRLAKDLVPLTSSCFAYARVKTYAQLWLNILDYKGRHDGDCLPCIARRISLHHAKVPSKYDDFLIDVFNIFNSPIFLTMPKHSLEVVVRVADLLRFCQYVSTMPAEKLVITFPDLYISAKGLDANKLTDMYKRYAEETISCFNKKSSSGFLKIFKSAFTME